MDGHQIPVLYNYWLLLMCSLWYVHWFLMLRLVSSGLQTCNSASIHASFSRSSKYSKQPMHFILDTSLCTHIVCVFTFFQMNSTQACTQTDSNLPCQSRMDRHDRNDSNVVHFYNCYSFTPWMPDREETLKWKRQITNTLFDKEWQVNDALLKPSISITIHDKGVPGFTPIISKTVMLKNDLHADLHALTRWLKRLDTKFTFLYVNLMWKMFILWSCL